MDSKKRLFLSGASSGLGRALAKELAQRGWRLAIAARRKDLLEQLAAEIRSQHPSARVYTFCIDVRREEEAAAAVREAAKELGGLDAVVANAGIGIPALSASMTTADLRTVMETNVMGAWTLLQAGLPYVMKSERGLLAAVSSMAGWRGGPGAASYNASKSALQGLLESIRPELKDEGVQVLDIAPGFVRTPMTDRNAFDMPFLMEPERAAKIIAKAIERRKAHCAFPLPMKLLLGTARRLPDGLFDRLNLGLFRRLRKNNSFRSQEPQDT